MSEQASNSLTFPKEYQSLIGLAQDKFNIKLQPLQLLVGGYSGAMVYLVSTASLDAHHIEHCILKLDHKRKIKKSDEITRHRAVMHKSPSEFASIHVPELAFESVEEEGAIAIFYRIAGESLLNYLPLSRFEQQNQVKTIFQETNNLLLAKWNRNLAFVQGVHPQKALEKWLGFRLEAGRNIESFIKRTLQGNPDIPGLLINDAIFPNPLPYARQPENWGDVRPMDIATGFIHGDLNTNNILAQFSENNADLQGYYLIDFALFKEDMPLLYDQRYLEMSYLMLSLDQVSFPKFVKFLSQLAEMDIPHPHEVPIEMSGVGAVIAASREAFAVWVQENYPSLHDDLWGQYWLAGAAAGLAYTHKKGLPDKERLAGLIFAAANLKRYLLTFHLPLPTEVNLLYDENQSGEDVPVIAKSNQSAYKLPTQPTPFVGRKEQIAELKALIKRSDVQLVTLLGPGGTGKTRLCIQVGKEVVDDFPDGVIFVSLADDANADQFISRVAHQLEVREGGRPLLESIKDYLYDKHLLLILDNFEQLVDEAPIVANLLAIAPKLKIITTSRAALNLQGEHIFHVPPLKLPQYEDNLSITRLMENESIKLFVDRAQSVRPNFSLEKENFASVVEICRRLDGLPLAIELAAARVKVLQPQAILSHLDDRLKFLKGGSRDLPARQQTLRNTLEWSYDLLGESERQLFDRLSVFVGGFTLEAVEAVCNPKGHLDILEGLTTLINNSLIRQDDTPDGEPRFTMLETIRSYALEQLTKSGELETLRRNHANFFGEVVNHRIGFEIYSSKALYWLNWLERELDNIRATISWSLDSQENIEMATQIVFSLIWFWYRRGYFIEGLMWAEQILASPAMQAPSMLRALALSASGILAVWKGEQDKGLKQLQESLAFLQETQTAEINQWIAPALMSNAVALINMGRDQAARPQLENARELFKQQGNAYFHTITLVHLGNVELGLGHPDRAHTVLEEAHAIAKTLNENWILSFVLNNLGEVARTQGKFALARQYYEECQGLLKDTGDRGDVARFVHSLGYIAQHEEDFELAESQFRDSLQKFRRLGNRRGIAESLAGLAGLQARRGHLQWGATLLGAAENLLQSTGGAWWPADRLEVEQNRTSLEYALSDEEFLKAWQDGEKMTIEQAIEFASHAP